MRQTEDPDPALPGGRAELPTERRLELAARAAWLYHAKGRRQDQIADQLNVSRQVVQRLIAFAASENLLRFHLSHPLSGCIELADRLKDKYGLVHCEVTLAERGQDEDIVTVTTASALYLEKLFQQKGALTVGIGNGQAMRETTLRLSPLSRPQHRIVSLMGNLTRQGRASHYDVVMRMAERVGAQCYPLPMPVVTNSVAERKVLQAQQAYLSCLSLLENAAALLMGIGYMSLQAPMYLDGFITDAELEAALDEGAIGEVLGHGITGDGAIVRGGYHARLTSYALPVPAQRPTIIVQSGSIRVPAIHGALRGKLANGLITDENTARMLVEH